MNLKITYCFKTPIVQKSIPFIIGLFIFYISKNHFFFWDTISQISIPANWYLDNNFKSFWIPDYSSTGHLPFLPLYVAAGWSLFGKSILITNLLFLPFIIGTIYQLKSLSEKIFPDRISFQNLALLLVLLDATLLSQLSMITPDIPHMFFYILAINAILSNKKSLFFIACTLMGLVSMRGTITVGGLAIFYLWYQIYSNKLRIRELLPLFYSILIISSIYGLHYISKGWIIHNINSDNWTSSSKFAPFPLVIKNIIVFFWQLADYGRIILWAICGFTFLKQLKTRSSVDNKTAILMVLIISQTIIWFPITVAYQNAFGHRYFLPIIVLLPYLTLLVIRSYLNQKKILTAICIIALIGGYFIVYPKKTAQGWDATPAHWPYYSLRKEMINYIDDQSIDKNSISSFFPNLASSYNIDLDTENTFKFNQFDKEKSQYVFYSNVYNMSDEAIDLLFYSNSFSKKHVIKKGQIYVILFERDLEPGTTPPEP